MPCGLLLDGYIQGQKDAAFEKAFAGFCNVNYCAGTGNGLDALMPASKAFFRICKIFCQKK